MRSALDLYSRGKEIVDDAIRTDLRGDYSRAVSKYKDACDVFIQALRYGQIHIFSHHSDMYIFI